MTVAVIATTIAACTVSAAQTSSRETSSFLWKIQSATGVLYLAGSVHALSADVYPLNPAFQRAFEASGTLVEEIDLASATMLAAAPLLLTKGMYQDGRTFDRVVSKETSALVAARLKDSPLSLEMLRPMKPWMVMLVLTSMLVQQAGFDANLGLDKYFFDKAVAAGKTVISLETAESQVDRFDRMSEPLQEQMLRTALADMDAESRELKAIVAAWQRGDRDALERTLLAGFKDYPAAYASLIVERNRNWLPQIEACFARTSPCFVVVGAAHLVGADGLLALLQQKGYRIEQL
jgi:uncharacterized protein